MEYFTILVCLTCIGSVNLFKLDESQVNQWTAKFKTDLDTRIDKMLGYQQVKSMLHKYESELGFVPIKGDETFKQIFERVNSKYNDLVLAVNKLKSGIEKALTDQQADEPDIYSSETESIRDQDDNFGGPPAPGNGSPPLGSGPAPPLRPSGGGPAPPIPGAPDKPLQRCCVPGKGQKYDGRFREDVKMEACYENVDETLKNISNSGIENVFKANLVNSSVTWQYFADRAGHYVQYPSNQRMCDNTSPNNTSPLLAEWFVEKLYTERKNVVILLDNGEKTAAQSHKGAQTAPPSQEAKTDRELLADAVKETLKTLTPNDKVNIVTLSPSGAAHQIQVAGCGDKLFVASQANLDKLAKFASERLPLERGDLDLNQGLTKAYQLYEAEQRNNKAGFVSRTNLVLLLMSGKSDVTGTQGTELFEMMAKQQKLLGNSIQHFVYVVGRPSNSSVTKVLAQIADQNNGRLNRSSGIAAQPWPQIPNLVESGKKVGKEGVLEIVENREQFPVTVATYFGRLPPQLDSRPVTTIVPVLDKSLGVTMSVAAAVFGQDKVVAVGAAAVDASLAEVFSPVTGVDVGHKSYGVLVDVTHGHVLLHPKLRDGSSGHHGNTMFPRLQLLEPDLDDTQVQAVLQAKESLSSLNATISQDRTTVTGELVKTGSSKREPVTLYYQLVSGTSLCVVFVHFLSDSEEARLQTQVPKGSLHAPYHRIDELIPSPVLGNKPNTENVCHLYGNFLSYKESVIKLSPWVFKNPVEYKYKPESFNQIEELNKFLINDGPTTVIREDLKILMQHFVRSTDGLDDLWKEGDKEVTERFLGSTSGVFRLYPGSPLDNTFDHMHTDWYKRSIAFPNVTMYHYGKLSFINHRDVLIVTRALEDKGRLQGVIGMTTTKRLLTSNLIKSVAECYGGEKQCHVVDASGNILDSFVDEDKSHLSELYPWLTSTLSRKGQLMVDWCTGFSDGYHKETFTLNQTMTSDLSASSPCRQFSLQTIGGTNLFILVMGNRTQLKCDDMKYEICRSCQNAAPNPYGLSMPKCQLCLTSLTTQCQCQCYCDTDLDPCEGQFRVNMPNFPSDACFCPVQQNTRLDLIPKKAGPDSGLDFCPLPCAAIEDLDICVALGHCKLDSSLYPTCIWKEGEELKNSNISKFFPTTTMAPPSTPPRPPNPTSKQTGPTAITKSSVVPPVVTNKGTPSSVKPETPTQPSTAKPKTTQKIGTSTPRSKTTTIKINSPSSKAIPSTSPGSVSRVSVPKSPATTDSSKHSVTGSSPTLSISALSTTVKALQSEEPDDGGMSGGAIAALVIGILVLVIVMTLLAVRIYNKKFRRPGADTSTKYRSGSGLFDSTIFHRATEQVVARTGQATNVPYEEMQHP